ncbi:hypothetical protein [Pseudorhodobacter ferrugineus]|uniref:hypothetical protein n=1 Tax=Pseudorhodobacter ferrugineus TaxID=77008 RepID=UPI0003B6F6F7|nr:hypothetical protein [Pseudorhodobacter ferrugineus]
MKLVFAVMVVGLGACSAPRLNANIGIGAGGVTVTPAVTARVGGANISVSP